MENSGGISASLQGRYASALFELAHENKAAAAVEADLGALGQALAQVNGQCELVGLFLVAALLTLKNWLASWWVETLN